MARVWCLPSGSDVQAGRERQAGRASDCVERKRFGFGTISRSNQRDRARRLARGPQTSANLATLTPSILRPASPRVHPHKNRGV
jgi:hypothetical protein